MLFVLTHVVHLVSNASSDFGTIDAAPASFVGHGSWEGHEIQ